MMSAQTTGEITSASRPLPPAPCPRKSPQKRLLTLVRVGAWGAREGGVGGIPRLDEVGQPLQQDGHDGLVQVGPDRQCLRVDLFLRLCCCLLRQRRLLTRNTRFFLGPAAPPLQTTSRRPARRSAALPCCLSPCLLHRLGVRAAWSRRDSVTGWDLVRVLRC